MGGGGGQGSLADLILFFCTLKMEIFNVCCVFLLLFGDTAWVYFFLSFNLLGKLCFAFAQPPPYPITFLMVQLLHKWITYLRQPRSNE